MLPLLMPVLVSAAASAQDTWKPTRPITLIVPNAAAGTSDRTAREMQRIIQAHKLTDVAVVIENRPGGNGTIALNQLRAKPGDAHTLLIMNSTVLSAHILGLSPYAHSEFTPIALVIEEYYGINVRANSPIQTGADMLNRLRKNPESLTFGGASITGDNYTSLLTALKKGGIDVKRLKTVSFPGGAQSTMALLGGHVDVISTGLGNMVEHLQAGTMRTLVVTGPKRMWGPFASVPTWKEVGVDYVATTWRGVMGPKDLTPAQIAYWDALLRKITQTDEWKQEAKENYWASTYTGPAETRRRLDAEYADLKQILGDLGMLKPK